MMSVAGVGFISEVVRPLKRGFLSTVVWTSPSSPLHKVVVVIMSPEVRLPEQFRRHLKELPCNSADHSFPEKSRLGPLDSRHIGRCLNISQQVQVAHVLVASSDL